MKGKKITVGQTFEVEMLRNEKEPIRPICKIFGRICFIHKKDANYPAEGETWEILVSVVKDNYLVISPVRRVLDAERTEMIKWHKMKRLQEKFNTK